MFLILNHNDDDEDWETRPAQARLASSCLFNYSKLQLQLLCNFLQPCTDVNRDENAKLGKTEIQKYKNMKQQKIQKYEFICKFLQPCNNDDLGANAELQKYRNIKIQKYRNAKIENT